MKLPVHKDCDLAIQHHLEAYGCVTPGMLKKFYRGLNPSTLYGHYRHYPRIPIQGRPGYHHVIAHPGHRRRKKLSLDPALMGLGDAWVNHFWSATGRPYVGPALDQWLRSQGYADSERPRVANSGFLGTSMVLTTDGAVIIPMYLGAGRNSADEYTLNIGQRWIETWHTVLAHPAIREVHVAGYGAGSPDVLEAKLRTALKVIHKPGLEAQARTMARRPLTSLRWSATLLALADLPLTKFVGTVLGFELKNGRIQAQANLERLSLWGASRDRQWIINPDPFYLDK